MEYFCQNPKCKAHILVDSGLARSGRLELAEKEMPSVVPCNLPPKKVQNTITVNRVPLENAQDPGWSMWACSLCWDNEKSDWKIN